MLELVFPEGLSPKQLKEMDLAAPKAPQFHGVGPKPGIIEISDRVKSTTAFKNHLNRFGNRPNHKVSLYDTDSNTFVFDDPQQG